MGPFSLFVLLLLPQCDEQLPSAPSAGRGHVSNKVDLKNGGKMENQNINPNTNQQGYEDLWALAQIRSFFSVTSDFLEQPPKRLLGHGK